jgi:hypothetical protein
MLYWNEIRRLTFVTQCSATTKRYSNFGLNGTDKLVIFEKRNIYLLLVKFKSNDSDGG